VLGLDVSETKRVTFDEITESAIAEAFANPRTLNTDLVDAQQARRAVDRIVGYRLSPVLWRTVSSGISAGRVQSVALRLIVDREDEIRAFVAQEYWSFQGLFAKSSGSDLDAKLHAVDGKRLATPKDLEDASDAKLAERLLIDSEDAADELTARLRPLTTPCARSGAPRPSATPSRRSRPPRCRARRPSSGSRPVRPWRSPSSSTRASTSAASRSGSSPTCAPTR
jgi:DNA topoisomerase I